MGQDIEENKNAEFIVTTNEQYENVTVLDMLKICQALIDSGRSDYIFMNGRFFASFDVNDLKKAIYIWQ